MSKEINVSVKALAQAPQMSSAMSQIAQQMACQVASQSTEGSVDCTVIVREGFTLSKTVSYGQNTSSEWQNAVDSSAQQMLAQLEQDMGGGIRETDPGTGQIKTGTMNTMGGKR